MKAEASFSKKSAEWLFTAPSVLWLSVFFVIPTVLILGTALRPADLHGGVAEGWSLEAVRAMTDAVYPPIWWRTLWMSAATTLLCLLIALPVGWHLARLTRRWQGIVLLLLTLPFLTNFLIRVFAWKALLHPEGALTRLCLALGWMSEEQQLLYNAGSVLAVLVYVHLPFAILPVYAAAEKLDFSLLDAARDLGAGPLRAFVAVFLPGVLGGIGAGGVMVFTGCLGQYVVPQIVGGTGDEMIGSKIAQRAFSDRNLPEAASLTGVLLLAMLVLLLMCAWRRKEASTNGHE